MNGENQPRGPRPQGVYPGLGNEHGNQQQAPIAMDPNILVLLNQTLQGINTTLAQQPQAAPGGAAPAAGGNQRFDTKIPPYYAKTGESFSNFERQARLIAQMNGWSVTNTAIATLAAMRGAATGMTKTMTVTEGQFKNVDEFFTELRKMFVNPAYKQVAQAIFTSRAQKAQENVREFHNNLAVLWWDAYGEEEEPWRIDPAVKVPEGRAMTEPKGFKSWRLINQFMRGLRDRTLRSAMKLLIKSNGHITDYPSALERVMSIQADRQQLAVEDMHVKQCDNAPSFDEFDQAMVKTKPGKKAKDDEEPMEIGALSAPPRYGQQRPKPLYGKPQNASGKFYCVRHGYCGHTTNNCKMYNSRLATARTGAVPKAQQQQPRRQVRILTGTGQQEKQQTERLCYNCNRPGHFIKDCPHKRMNHMIQEEEYVEEQEFYEHEDHAQEEYDDDQEEEDAYMNHLSENMGADTLLPAFLSYNHGLVGN